jgi:uracil-DNA glycosylase
MPLANDTVLETLLNWYLAAGADEAIGDVPIDRLATPGRGPLAREAPLPKTNAPEAPLVKTAPLPFKPLRAPAAPAIGLGPDSPAAAIAAAREAAASAATLDALRQAVDAFEGCALRRTATHTVFADGVPESRVVFIGEAPGADEDRIGRPFVGVSGQLLDRMLATIGLDRARNAYIMNVLYWRPPGNRKPTDTEIAICRPFVERQIALIDPQLIVLVGGTASAGMIPGSAGITRIRGKWVTLPVNGLDAPIPAMPMYHPSFLLRSPERKRESWADLLSIKSKLKQVQV